MPATMRAPWDPQRSQVFDAIQVHTLCHVRALGGLTEQVSVTTSNSSREETEDHCS